MKVRVWLSAIKAAFIVAVLGVAPCFGAAYYIPDIGNSARYIGIGGMQGLDDASSVVFSNPAALSKKSQGISAFYTTFAQGDVDYYSFSAAYSLAPKITLGLGFSQLGTNGVPITQLDNSDEFIQSGSFSYFNRMAKLGISYALRNDLSIGTSLSGFQKSFYGITGKGINMDVGMQWKPKASSFQLSMVGHEILPQAVGYSNGGTESFASRWSIAGVYEPAFFNSLNLYGQLTYHTHTEKQFTKSVGAAYYLTHDRNVYLTGSVREIVDLGKVRAVPAFGLVVAVSRIQFEYALETSDYLNQNTQHYFGLNLKY